MRKFFILAAAVAGVYVLASAFKKGLDCIDELMDPFGNWY